MLLPEELYAHLPRKVEDWDAADVQKWFALNNIQTSAAFSFTREGFNGFALRNASPEYLLGTCGVTSRIIMKKIFEWLEYDREDFEEYVDEHPPTSPSQQSKSQDFLQADLEPTERPSTENSKVEAEWLPTEKTEKERCDSPLGESERHCEAIMAVQVKKWKKKKPASQESILPRQNSKENSKKMTNRAEHFPIGASFVKSIYELIEAIIEFRFDGKTQYLSNTGKIGRNTTNDIIIVADSVSRRHAEIIKENNEFYIKDADSKFGTFVSIGVKNRTIIHEGDIIAFEDHQIEILKYKYLKNNGTFDLKIRRMRQKDAISSYFGKKSVTVGREEERDVRIDEPTVCPLHARMLCDGGGQLLILEEAGKCFRKLRKEELYKLEEWDQAVRLGLVVSDIRLRSTHRPAPVITEFNTPLNFS